MRGKAKKDFSVLTDVLVDLQRKNVYYKAGPGNNGDTLIIVNARRLLADLGLEVVTTADQADVLLLNAAGGMFCQPWCGGLEVAQRWLAQFADHPVIVPPASFWWGDADIGRCFSGRQAPTHLFCRERGSYDRLCAAGLPESVQIAMCPDMAFYMAGSDLVEEAKGQPDEGYVLVVERFDAEQGIGQTWLSDDRMRWAWKLPKPIKRIGKVCRDMLRRRTSVVKQSALKQAYQIMPELSARPVVYEDVSNERQFSFDHFINRIASAHAVVTTRLHAGIFAGLLGKPTFLKDGSSYRKLSEVYEYSMADWPHVHLLA